MFGCLKVEGGPLSDNDLICLIVGAEAMLASHTSYLSVAGKGDSEEIELSTDFKEVSLEYLSGTRFKARLRGNGRKTSVDFVFSPEDEEDEIETTFSVRPVIPEDHPALSAYLN